MSGAVIDPRHRPARAAPPKRLRLSWSDPRFRNIVWQVLIIGVIAACLWYLVTNTNRNLEARRITTGFGFLGRVAAIPIGEHLISYDPAVDTYGRALLIGVLNTLNAAIPHLSAGASMIVTGSLAALLPGGPGGQPGGAAYSWAKRSLITLVHDLALVLAPHEIRLNGVHPTNCNTDMLQHEDMYRQFRPDLEHPTKEDAMLGFPALQAIPVPWVEPADISQTMVFLASDESRYITGQFIAVDAGGHLKI